MKPIVIFVPVRVSSRRLPYKHFHNVGGQPALDALLDSTLRLIGREQLCLITSNEPEDDYVETYAEARGLPCFRGSLSSVLRRFLRACEEHPAEWFGRLNGDSIALLEQIFREFEEAAKEGEVDVFTTVGTNAPSGVHFEAVSASLVQDLQRQEAASHASDHEHEHIFPFFYSRTERIHVCSCTQSDFASVKVSLDTVRDLEFRRALDAENVVVRNLSDLERVSDVLSRFNAARCFQGENGPLLVAEVGGNHEGDFSKAVDLVDQATESLADVVKLQIYHPDLLVNSKLDPNRHEHFQGFTLTHDQNAQLLERIARSGKAAAASIWSTEQFGIFGGLLDFIKVGSGDFDDHLMLEVVVSSGLPIILSSGLASLGEVERIVEHITLTLGAPAERIGLLQCTSMYPIPPIEANLNVMGTYRKLFDVTVGYSDHTVGIAALVSAFTRGAKILEFHFSDDPGRTTFRDHLVSLDLNDVERLVERILEEFSLGGSALKTPSLLERTTAHTTSFRKGLFLRRPLSAGTRVAKADLISLRPRSGLCPADADHLVGRRTVVDVEALAPLAWSMFEEPSSQKQVAPGTDA